MVECGYCGKRILRAQSRVIVKTDPDPSVCPLVYHKECYLKLLKE